MIGKKNNIGKKPFLFAFSTLYFESQDL